jgi:hypothetical protein
MMRLADTFREIQSDTRGPISRSRHRRHRPLARGIDHPQKQMSGFVYQAGELPVHE